MILFPFILVYIHSCCTCQLMTLFPFQKKVIFSARRTSRGDFAGLVSYDTIDVNIGGGMQTNGKFIAPESGTYGFTFSGVTYDKKSYPKVEVYKDDYSHHYIYEPNVSDYHKKINSSWMMKLSKGQRVHLTVTDGKLYATSHFPVIFTGNLLMLDD